MRRQFFLVSIPLLILLALGALTGTMSWGWFGTAAVVFILGLYDVFQTRHTILRNFPVIGHLRYVFEMFRPEIQQYFIESDVTPDPIARIHRAVVYQRSKNQLDTVPFGSELDLYAPDYQWINHSVFPVSMDDDRDFRVRIGNASCKHPYDASLLNVSAMSFGAISKTAVQALSHGARAGGFSLNTGEGGLSPYHLAGGADIVWQIGTAYFGCRDERGFFAPELFRAQAADPRVKMIELKLSQGAKPGHGGILPGVKVDPEIARIRRVPVGKTVISPPGHSAFGDPAGLCRFVGTLRELSGGKPVGFKLCLGRREEFVEICEAMNATGIYPDFITVDGAEGGSGAAPFEFINYVGSPLNEALYFVDSTLKAHGARAHIKVIASGKVMSGFDIFEKLALGADLCNSARGMMLALGCIQAYRCNSNKCPTGIATNDPALQRGLDATDKSVRVATFHRKTIQAFNELLGAAGLHRPEDIGLANISRRDHGVIANLHEIYQRTSTLSPHERADKSRPDRHHHVYPVEPPTPS
jgi:glutamate synthase domain-containing protein 2